MKARYPETLPVAVSAVSSFVPSRREVFVRPLESAPVASSSSPCCRAPDPATVYISTIVHTG